MCTHTYLCIYTQTHISIYLLHIYKIYYVYI